MDGCFSQPSYNTVGDPYDEKRGEGKNKSNDDALKGKRQFLTSSSKSGQTGADWGTGPRQFVGLTGNYQEKYKEECKYRLKNTKKYLNPLGFTYSNPSSKSCSLGDFNGTFSKGYQYMNDGKYKAGGDAKKFEMSQMEKRNIITSPCKKGTYGYNGTLIGGIEIPAFKNDDEPKAKKKNNDESGGDEQPAFKSMASRLDYFDSHNHCAASKVYGWDDECKQRQPSPEDSMTPKERVEKNMTGLKEWKPSHAGHSGKSATFDLFPDQMPDPYDERIVNHAMLPNRRNPVKTATKDLPESIRERVAFRPSNGTKSKLTKGTCLIGITKHHI